MIDGPIVVPCRTCGAPHRVDTYCHRTEECRRHADACIEAADKEHERIGARG